MSECQHGSLRDKCEICERDDEILRIKQVLLQSHFYFVNGSYVLGLKEIKDYLKSEGVVEEDGITWTKKAFDIAEWWK